MNTTRRMISLLILGMAVVLTLTSCGMASTTLENAESLDESELTETLGESESLEVVDDSATSGPEDVENSSEPSVVNAEDAPASSYLNADDWVNKGQKFGGVDPESEKGQCIEQYKGLLNEDTLYYYMGKCGMEEASELLLFGVYDINAAASGMTLEELACVIDETMIVIQALPEVEGLAAIKGPAFPVQHLDQITPSAVEACGVTAEMIRITTTTSG